MTSDPYDWLTHCHNFGVWTASRGLARGSYRLTTAQAKEVLERSGVRDFVQRPPDIIDQQAFDDLHREWRNRASAEEISHGSAAKLLNVYLKTTLLMMRAGEGPAARYMHPPVDRRLLDALTRNKVAQLPWRQLSVGGWSNFCSHQYEAVIQAIVRASGDRPLWQIEKYWTPSD